MAASSTDNIRTNETTEETNSYYEVETPTKPRVARELPSQILLTEDVTPSLRATWIDSPVRMRSVLIFNRVDQVFEALARGLWRLVMIGVLLSVAAHFAPELREQLPMLYSVCDGGMKVLNTLWCVAFHIINMVVGGESFGELTHLINENWNELLREFMTWLATI